MYIILFKAKVNHIPTNPFPQYDRKSGHFIKEGGQSLWIINLLTHSQYAEAINTTHFHITVSNKIVSLCGRFRHFQHTPFKLQQEKNEKQTYPVDSFIRRKFLERFQRQLIKILHHFRRHVMAATGFLHSFICHFGNFGSSYPTLSVLLSIGRYACFKIFEKDNIQAWKDTRNRNFNGIVYNTILPVILRGRADCLFDGNHQLLILSLKIWVNTRHWWRRGCFIWKWDV